MAQIINTTGTSSLSPEMKTFYDKDLIRNAKPVLVHNQFGQKRNIPKNGGKTIEFRRFSPLPKALTPLTEGVTPDGEQLTVTNITATVGQYGDYVALTDVIQMAAIDPVLIETNKLLGVQAGETLDRLTANVLNAGTNVQYAGGKESRSTLAEGDVLTVDDIKKAVRTLKMNKAKPINGSYVAIIDPEVAYDLMKDKEWIDVKTYSDPKGIYTGEIGKLYGVRFVETTEAVTFKESSNTVHSTLVLGADAYGITSIDGGGLTNIVKQLGSAGSADPLNQRSTSGWKAIHVAKILVEEYMVRIESLASA